VTTERSTVSTNVLFPLSSQYRQLLWQRDDWSLALEELVEELSCGPASTEALVEAAAACEAIVPQSQLAISLYTKAFAAGAGEDCCERAIKLARQCGDFAAISSIASLRYAAAPAPHLLEAHAVALIDAQDMVAAQNAVGRARRAGVDSELIRAIESAFSADDTKCSELLRRLEAQAYPMRDATAKANHLLTAARVAAIGKRHREQETLLLGVLEAKPGEATAFALLEGMWLKAGEWDRLSVLYRMRTNSAATAAEKVEAYRLAGTRLVLGSVRKATGIRLLQQAIAIVYQEELESVPDLIAMLGLLTDRLELAGSGPSAIRLLGQALAHPRSEDEAMWIVNRGLWLAGDDPAFRRTVTNLEVLRTTLLASEPSLLVALATTEIDGEVQERNHPPGLAEGVAERAFVAADVAIAVRAKVSSSAGHAHGITRDLSETGLFLACELVLPLGEAIDLTIFLPGADDWSLSEHHLTGNVARVVEGIGYGIRLVSAPESYCADIRALCSGR
jgi:hypothetical protein